MQVLARLNATADDSGDEKVKRGREVSYQDTSTSSDQGQSLDENALSNDADSDTDTLERIDPAPRKFTSSSNTTSDTACDVLVAPSNLAKIQLLAKDGTKWELTNLSSESRGRAEAQNALTESEGLTRYTNHMIDGPLSSFELLFTHNMLLHIQQCTEAEAHGVNNSNNR